MGKKIEFLYEGNIISYEEDGMGMKLLVNGVFQDKHTFVTPFGTSVKGKLEGKNVEVICKSRLLYYLTELHIDNKLVESRKTLT
ncbi:hypothetical protein CVD25_14895 [Bacillus canaveralius]|uniref:Uncharacterized protein n=1 Tax=Bacillus canaveralius TaxID=1403243 RepID=A0A2N5GMX5_9BACI|nr:hypothetical protein [Bacillus canaveralius]PLR83469.1 hypothetical protein CU635_09240 [Bacillus canaveralius]PLR95350.1 hypothetical protein CVD25_14895 [Bacillus canaveralius]